jgi:hypothetical protein
VVAARQRVISHAYPDCWPELIFDLTPNWLVLRSHEAEAIRRKSPELFERFYTLAKTFDVRAQVAAVPSILGRGYLINDAYFEVYRRQIESLRDGSLVGLQPINTKRLVINESWGRPAYDSGTNLVCHAPSRLAFAKPPGAHWFSGSFGIFEGAYADPKNSTDGAVFTVVLVSPDGARKELFRRTLNPRDLAADRGKQTFALELPLALTASIEISTTPGASNSNAFDWTYWSDLLLEFSHAR